MNRKQLRPRRWIIFGGFIPLTAFCLLTIGCASTPETTYRHGRAYMNMFASQVVNWAAPDDPSPVDGMMGFISEGIFSKRYTETFVESEDDEKDD